jgi:hypothetical protein
MIAKEKGVLVDSLQKQEGRDERGVLGIPVGPHIVRSSGCGRGASAGRRQILRKTLHRQGPGPKLARGWGAARPRGNAAWAEG